MDDVISGLVVSNVTHGLMNFVSCRLIIMCGVLCNWNLFNTRDAQFFLMDFPLRSNPTLQIKNKLYSIENYKLHCI